MAILFWFSVSINTILLAKKSERWKACCLSWFLVSWLWVMPGTRKQNLQSEGAKKVIILRRGPRATPTVKFWWLSVRKWHERLTKHFFSITNSNVSFTLLAISISWEEAKLSPIFTSSHSRTGQRFDFSSCLVHGRSLSPPRLAFLSWGDFHARSRFAR